MIISYQNWDGLPRMLNTDYCIRIDVEAIQSESNYRIYAITSLGDMIVLADTIPYLSAINTHKALRDGLKRDIRTFEIDVVALRRPIPSDSSPEKPVVSGPTSPLPVPSDFDEEIVIDSSGQPIGKVIDASALSTVTTRDQYGRKRSRKQSL